MPYETLERQITALWKSRGLEVFTITVRAVGKNRFKWIVIAEGVEDDLNG